MLATCGHVSVRRHDYTVECISLLQGYKVAFGKFVLRRRRENLVPVKSIHALYFHFKITVIVGPANQTG
jgi:hypothetical protein